MVTPAVDGIDLFKIAGRSISGWIPSFKAGTTIRQPFCSQLEERLLLWLEYSPLVVSYARGDIGPEFARKYRLPIPEHAPFAIGYTFENKPHHYLPDVVGTLSNGKLFIAEALRQWSGIIYTWLTHSLLDPTNSGRVSMDNLIKLVTTALEWTYQAGKTDVSQQTLELAAELLLLRRDTFRIIDGAGPSVEERDAVAESPAQAEPSGAKQESQTLSPKPEHDTSREGAEGQKQPTTQPKCTFCGVVSIDLQQFLDSGVSQVECPDCTSTSSLTPHKGILQFKPHKRRKTRSTSTEPRWTRREMVWVVVNQ